MRRTDILIRAASTLLVALLGCSSTPSSTHPPGNPFTCGDATCVTGQTYCRIRSGPFTGPDGGELPPTYSCQSLCSADDCSCVPVNQGDTYCQSNGCEKTDAGAVTVHCGPI